MQQQMQQMLNSNSLLHAKMDNFMAELNSVKARVGEVESDMKAAFSEIYGLKDKCNHFEQRERSLTIRIFSVPMSSDEKDSTDPSKAAAKTAYDRILKPILTAAKDKALIPTVPTIANVITDAYRVKPKNSTPAKPTALVIKLASPALKTAIFKSKKDSVPQPTPAESEMGIKRFHIAEDLTGDTYDLLYSLRDHQKIERAWTTDGQIRFIKKGDTTNFVHKVKSVFESPDTIVG